MTDKPDDQSNQPVHDDYGPFLYEGKQMDAKGFAVPFVPDRPLELQGVLAKIDKAMLPSPLPPCATCPARIWRVKQGRDKPLLSCFCKVFHDIVFDTANAQLDPMIECDGVQVAAVEELRLHLDQQMNDDPSPENKP